MGAPNACGLGLEMRFNALAGHRVVALGLGEQLPLPRIRSSLRPGQLAGLVIGLFGEPNDLTGDIHRGLGGDPGEQLLRSVVLVPVLPVDLGPGVEDGALDLLQVLEGVESGRDGGQPERGQAGPASAAARSYPGSGIASRSAEALSSSFITSQAAGLAAWTSIRSRSHSAGRGTLRHCSPTRSRTSGLPSPFRVTCTSRSWPIRMTSAAAPSSGTPSVRWVILARLVRSIPSTVRSAARWEDFPLAFEPARTVMPSRSIVLSWIPITALTVSLEIVEPAGRRGGRGRWVLEQPRLRGGLLGGGHGLLREPPLALGLRLLLLGRRRARPGHQGSTVVAGDRGRSHHRGQDRRRQLRVGAGLRGLGLQLVGHAVETRLRGIRLLPLAGELLGQDLGPGRLALVDRAVDVAEYFDLRGAGRPDLVPQVLLQLGGRDVQEPRTSR